VSAVVAPAAAADAPCVLDIEASGFGRASYPIEIGWVLPDGRARCTLIRPPAHWTHWDEEAERVHGIRRDALLRHGRSPQEVARQLNEDLAGRTVYCDGWAHDYPWLGALFDEAGFPPSFRLDTAVRCLDEAGTAALPAAHREALAGLGLARHRASNDARALQQALIRLRPARAAAAVPHAGIQGQD
jgi:hypothetical protein